MGFLWESLRRRRGSLQVVLCAPLLGAAHAVAGPPTPSQGDQGPVRCSAEGCALGVCQTRTLLRDPMGALAPARIVPEVRAGVASGFKLYGVRAGSLPALLGLQNGDVVTTLNGQSLAGPQEALQALDAALDPATTTLRIGLTRGGRPVERRVLLDRRAVSDTECPPPQAKGVAGPGHASGHASAPSPAHLPADADLGRGIRCQGMQCRVRADLRDRVLNDPSWLARGARIVPQFVGGQSTGLRLLAIRPGSVYALLGLQNGDIIEKIAGQPVTSAESALALHSQVRASPRIPIDLRRQGAVQTLTIEVDR